MARDKPRRGFFIPTASKLTVATNYSVSSARPADYAATKYAAVVLVTVT